MIQNLFSFSFLVWRRDRGQLHHTNRKGSRRHHFASLLMPSALHPHPHKHPIIAFQSMLVFPHTMLNGKVQLRVTHGSAELTNCSKYVPINIDVLSQAYNATATHNCLSARVNNFWYSSLMSKTLAPKRSSLSSSQLCMKIVLCYPMAVCRLSTF